jgi:hypothetical protein
LSCDPNQCPASTGQALSFPRDSKRLLCSHVSPAPPHFTNHNPSLTCRPALDTLPAKLGALPAGHIVVALDLQPRALIAGMAFASSLQRTRDRGVSATLAATEMVPQHITTTSPVSAENFPVALRSTYLRLKVLEQNLQLYGRSPESAMRYQNPKAIRDTRGRETGGM